MKKLTRSGALPRSLRSRLIRYMLVLTATVLAVLLAALALLGRFRSDRRELADTLELQLDFMEKEVTTRGDNLAAMGVELSRTASVLVEQELARQNRDFAALNGSDPGLAAMQEALLPSLRGFLLRSQCSGAFVLLDVSGEGPGSPTRSGIYLQRQGVSPTDDTLLLYRGCHQTARAAGILPHRKWRLESRAEGLPADLASPSLPPEEAYAYTPILPLPGTSEQAMLLLLPLQGSGGERYGLCGFEVSRSYFKLHCAQPARLPHLTFLLYREEEPNGVPAEFLAAGTDSGYFSAPSGPLTTEPLGRSMTLFRGEARAYAGCVRPLSLSPGDSAARLAVILPREDYSRILRSSFWEAALLTGLLLVFASACCLLFSRRYLLPILRTVDALKEGGAPEDSGYREIDDLLAFLARRDQSHADALRTLESEKEDAQTRADLIRQACDRALSDCEQARKEASRLAGMQLQGTDSEAFAEFRRGLRELTPTEKTIFRYYLEGKTVREIMEITHTKESTLRYHNHNIYGKLGVRSLKQLLQFAALLQNSQDC